MSEITIQEFDPEMVNETSTVLARAFVTNPINVAVFGADQLSISEDFFKGSLRIMRGRKLVALDDSRIVGFAHWVVSPQCQLSEVEKLAMLPKLIQKFGLFRAQRIGTWLSAWSKQDPKDPHSHLGPIGVDPTVQGRGIGRLLMTRYCDDLDQTATSGYLETDRPENVVFYQRFGFNVTREILVLGTPNFLMERFPATKD